ncbi:PIN domain-containing protein [Ralstonia solanacearum]|uniref:PIN domain-containing protein n=1 Tax=Ralstonia solanacearum TaxID=305 RepID=UPI0009BD276D|nr:PIN domain-containing protein [Ralstonia solanacearum]
MAKLNPKSNDAPPPMATNSHLDALLFVDTNVLLDFYRIRKSDVSTRYLQQLEECRDRLILGSQIEMEFKKNRQRVIVEALGSFALPDWGKLSPPALVADTKACKMIEKKKIDLIGQHKNVSEKVRSILGDPTRHDPVYKTLQRLFKHNSPYNLARTKKERFEIRNLARKRFVLGYPPRKQSDTSIGDSINLEWIVQCSKKSGKNVVIITRDTDYGVAYKDKLYLNDWLRQEFSERVSKKRQIILTDKLSVALKTVHKSVTREMEEEENTLLRHAIGRETQEEGNFLLCKRDRNFDELVLFRDAQDDSSNLQKITSTKS